MVCDVSNESFKLMEAETHGMETDMSNNFLDVRNRWEINTRRSSEEQERMPFLPRTGSS